ncbi:hypothetical protein BT69DRAFT_1352240 [Atractiella rhizophila]|nr:hypothetical protein BT69DRAFT_1352240 [Atractiella rhizophila]
MTRPVTFHDILGETIPDHRVGIHSREDYYQYVNCYNEKRYDELGLRFYNPQVTLEQRGERTYIGRDVIIEHLKSFNITWSHTATVNWMILDYRAAGCAAELVYEYVFTGRGNILPKDTDKPVGTREEIRVFARYDLDSEGRMHHIRLSSA